jgi:hypothetical protein
MSALSPAAQVVLDATYREMDYAPRRHVQWAAAAAALRAAADQVVPDSDAMRSPCREHCVIGGAAARIRAEFLAIAAELDGGTNTTSQEN